MLANARYLTALAVVDDPTEAKRDPDRVTTRSKMPPALCAAFNPLARPDAELFRAVMNGDCLRGFTNRNIRTKLRPTVHLKAHAKDLPNWSVYVDRVQQELLQANYLFPAYMSEPVITRLFFGSSLFFASFCSPHF